VLEDEHVDEHVDEHADEHADEHDFTLVDRVYLLAYNQV
jgi:hypothetical protein